MQAYENALAGQPQIEPGKTRHRSGTLNSVALSYVASQTFTLLAPNSQRNYRRAIERLCHRKDQTGQELGIKLISGMQRQHVIKLMAELKPQAANQLRKVLRAIMQHAVDLGFRGDDPTKDVKAIKTKVQSHHPWSDEEVGQFEAHWPIGTRERLALGLLLFTGQRSGDVRRMGPQHVQNGEIRITQEKTKAELTIPIHPDLHEILDATPSRHLTFIVTDRDGPYTSGSFSMWFKKACRAAGLPHCCAHGLRHAAARRLAEVGASTHEIAAITGHRSLGELTRYTRGADQRKLATLAMAKIRARTTSVKP
jgi:integrase